MFTLYRDGVEVMTGTEGEVWTWIHRNHCYSVDHALRWEGYRIERHPWTAPAPTARIWTKLESPTLISGCESPPLKSDADV